MEGPKTGFAVALDVLDPESAKRMGQPYVVSLGVNNATKEQFETGLKLLTVLTARLQKTYDERFGCEASSSYSRHRDTHLEEGGE